MVISSLDEYYKAVYPLGTRYTPEFLLSLNFFYDCIPVKFNIHDPAKDKNWNPPQLGIPWVPIWFGPNTFAINQYDPKQWWTNPVKDGFESNSVIELMHVSDDNPIYTVYGYWAYYAKGCGVFYSIGNTLITRNKIHALHLLGLSIDDITSLVTTSNYMINAGQTYSKVSDLAKTLFPSSKTPVKNLVKELVNNSHVYLIDRINNSADWDGTIVMLAHHQGYDSVQFTTQANGNGGWACEIVFTGMKDIIKTVEKNWPSWDYMLSRMFIKNPMNDTCCSCGSNSADQCIFDPKLPYNSVICSQQKIKKCVPINPAPSPPYTENFEQQQRNKFPILMLILITSMLVTILLIFYLKTRVKYI